jgi:DNA polymerase-3 subunit epsilon
MAERDTHAAQEYLSARMPARSTPWRELEFTVIDLETTGLNALRDEIVSFATVSVRNGRVSLTDARYELVRPRRMPGEETSRIHGLREADLIEAPPLEDLLDGLLEAITGRILVAHVAAIEIGFLTEALAAAGLRMRNRFVDTAQLALELSRMRRERPPETEPIGLSDLARSLGLPVHRRHTADGDALTTAQTFIALATHLDAFEPQTGESLVRASRPGQRSKPRGGLLGRLGLGRLRA